MATNVTVATWAEAQLAYRRLLEARLAHYLQTPVGREADRDNKKPLNAIMAQVPVHLLEQSKTGVAELEITVKLMRGTQDITNDNRNLCPTVKVNVDGRSPPPREQLPHIGFSVRADGSGESHVFVRESLPKGTTIRGKLGDGGQPYYLGTMVTSRGTGGSDKWHVSGVMRRFDKS